MLKLLKRLLSHTHVESLPAPCPTTTPRPWRYHTAHWNGPTGQRIRAHALTRTEEARHVTR